MLNITNRSFEEFYWRPYAVNDITLDHKNNKDNFAFLSFHFHFNVCDWVPFQRLFHNV